ncbi:hypothetical protein RB12853 [Rhodopirellula baltica SH 1]|uniref:Uncharacterized protein n=1 Tax=Rhodopirellula baltica (strain DSM 10527 / NCIMB 13988 / SH1) TaxID=243090 RepID=Q7UHZ7_RHOBA|nr:hypothetical protein RB12853 [Rhodopirellula baltica SH 1]
MLHMATKPMLWRDVRFTTCGTALLALHSAEIACSLQWGYRMD